MNPATVFHCQKHSIHEIRQIIASLSVSFQQPKLLKGLECEYPMTSVPSDKVEQCFKLLYEKSWGQSGDVKTTEDDELAKKQKASLLFGEVLPAGVDKLLDKNHLCASEAVSLTDMGAGMGKLVLQAFLQFTCLKTVQGIELCPSRYKESVHRISHLASLNPSIFQLKRKSDSHYDLVTLGESPQRTLTLLQGDMFKLEVLSDIVICETNVPVEEQPNILLGLSKYKPGTKVMLYHSLRNIPGVLLGQDNKVMFASASPNALKIYQQLAEKDSYFSTSWAKDKGHFFECWKCIS